MDVMAALSGRFATFRLHRLDPQQYRDELMGLLP